ncbi:MAG: hypothetical protein ACHQK9_11985 [Reyranellales bacterium]
MLGAQWPEQLARCTKLYDLWARYHLRYWPDGDGQRMRAELAFYQCKLGDFEPGTKELERLLRQNLLPIPKI